VTSWAAIDGDERPKPLWYGLRHAFADRLLAVVDRDGVPVVALVNDTDAVWAAPLRATRETFDGTVLAELVDDIAVAARSVRLVPVPSELAAPDDERREALVARFGGATTVRLFVEDVDADLDPEPLEVEVSPTAGGHRVQVRARSLARDVTLLADRLDPEAVVDDALVTLTAGESTTFHLRTTRDLQRSDLTAAVLRTANDAVAAATRPKEPARVP